MSKVYHFVGPTPYSYFERVLIAAGWRQTYLRYYPSSSTVRKLVKFKRK